MLLQLLNIPAYDPPPDVQSAERDQHVRANSGGKVAKAAKDQTPGARLSGGPGVRKLIGFLCE